MRGIEPRTPFLPRKCSATELHRQARLRKQEWTRLTWWAGWESNPQGQHGQRFYRPSPLPTGLPTLLKSQQRIWAHDFTFHLFLGASGGT